MGLECGWSVVHSFPPLCPSTDQIWSHFNRLASDLEAAAYPALDGLTANVSSTNLERVRRIKSR